jgi:hypothetical protein
MGRISRRMVFNRVANHAAPNRQLILQSTGPTSAGESGQNRRHVDQAT